MKRPCLGELPQRTRSKGPSAATGGPCCTDPCRCPRDSRGRQGVCKKQGSNCQRCRPRDHTALTHTSLPAALGCVQMVTPLICTVLATIKTARNYFAVLLSAAVGWHSDGTRGFRQDMRDGGEDTDGTYPGSPWIEAAPPSESLLWVALCAHRRVSTSQEATGGRIGRRLAVHPRHASCKRLQPPAKGAREVGASGGQESAAREAGHRSG